MNDITVGGERYRLVGQRNLSDLGSKFFGKWSFQLVKVSDGSKWRCSGKRVAHNSRLYEGWLT